MTKKKCWLVVVGVICVVGLAQLACAIPYKVHIAVPFTSATGKGGAMLNLRGGVRL